MKNIFDLPEDYKGSLREYYFSCLEESTASRLFEMVEVFDGSLENSVMNQTIVTPRGNKKWLSFSSFPKYDEEEDLVGVHGFVKDITDQVTGYSGLDNFFKLTGDLHCIVHLDGYFVKVSPGWTELLGYTEKELLSQSLYNFIHPDDLESSNMTAESIKKCNPKLSHENRYIKKNGEIVHLSWSTQKDEHTDLLYSTARNVTSIKHEREKLLSNLSEKELMLREIHHRVKNNLQIISSLLSLQAGLNSNHDDLSILYEASQNRIKSMAAIHEMFYQSENLDKIEFGKYLAKLTDDLIRTFESKNKKVEIDLKTETVFVSLNKAIPLGLIINEIVTNAIKHGADEQGKSFVFVNLECLPNKEFQLTIGDQSHKAFTDILNQEVESLGLMLIKSLTEQIDGGIRQVTTDTGTVFKMLLTP